MSKYPSFRDRSKLLKKSIVLGRSGDYTNELILEVLGV